VLKPSHDCDKNSLRPSRSCGYKAARRAISCRPRRRTPTPDSSAIRKVHHRSPAFTGAWSDAYDCPHIADCSTHLPHLHLLRGTGLSNSTGGCDGSAGALDCLLEDVIKETLGRVAGSPFRTERRPLLDLSGQKAAYGLVLSRWLLPSRLRQRTRRHLPDEPLAASWSRACRIVGQQSVDPRFEVEVHLQWLLSRGAKGDRHV